LLDFFFFALQSSCTNASYIKDLECKYFNIINGIWSLNLYIKEKSLKDLYNEKIVLKIEAALYSVYYRAG